MTNHKQIAYPLVPLESVKRQRDELIARRHIKRFKIQQALADRILRFIALSSIVSTGIFGIGALGCWGLEMIEANTKPIVLSKQYEWQKRKHTCLGWMLIGFSSLLGSASLTDKRHKQ